MRRVERELARQTDRHTGTQTLKAFRGTSFCLSFTLHVCFSLLLQAFLTLVPVSVPVPESWSSRFCRRARQKANAAVIESGERDESMAHRRIKIKEVCKVNSHSSMHASSVLCVRPPVGKRNGPRSVGFVECSCGCAYESSLPLILLFSLSGRE